MHLELFAGNGAPVEAADWLSAVVDKLEAFQIPSPDWVRYAGQLLKGEALVWWRSVISSRNATSGPVTWQDFVGQFERRFYPVAFMDKMKTQLERCHQGKQSVAEYEIVFNQIVRFVPHVAHDESEKARIFRQGLKASIRRVLGVFPIVDFRSVVEQALGVEVQDEFTEELRAGGREQGQRDQKGQTGQTRGPIKRKDNKHHRHQPYGGSTS